MYLSDGSYVEAHKSSLREDLQASVDGMQDILQAADHRHLTATLRTFSLPYAPRRLDRLSTK